eukprot:TRINITY_DN2521_c0_g1_i11.p1 TRINITY_DN2521_c0_g1~~TRINITY_DN2521_c0_g1_i11.p1  ORF type:complete len:142 (-),score=41.40 TRINITY_DN2521_c0_g1_i11:96-521(-)
MMLALGLFDGTPPPYAAHITIELRQIAEKPTSDEDFIVRAMFQNQTLTLPFCGGQTDCSYKLFKAHLSQFAIADDATYAQLCGKTSSSTSSSSWSALEVGLGVAVTILAVVVITLAVVLRATIKKLETSSLDTQYKQVPTY